MTPANEAYYELAEQWRLKGSESFVKLAELWVTPEEAKVLSKLNWWMTPEELAKKLKMDEEYVNTTLAKIMRTGLVRRKDGYWNAPLTPGFHSRRCLLPGYPEKSLMRCG